jgi:hypothetical protein
MFVMQVVITNEDCGFFAPEDEPQFTPLNDLAATADPTEVCFGHSSTLTASGGIGPYAWFLDGILIGEGNSVDVIPGVTTSYLLKDTGASCEETRKSS